MRGLSQHIAPLVICHCSVVVSRVADVMANCWNLAVVHL